MVPDEESLTSAAGGKRKEGEGEMGKQCLLQSEIKKRIMPTDLSMDLFFKSFVLMVAASVMPIFYMSAEICFIFIYVFIFRYLLLNMYQSIHLSKIVRLHLVCPQHVNKFSMNT